eukprot:TRINITY_DN2312_c0_g1_i2.p1 TRINITY_DN2312_c0_g1~~TRINITY_DN2312_c0_g1_i2.p1  ORF type:complete len:418 (-),score=80.09 TRINITY_DN2312_c0_g1_i2:2-1255(-)
MAPFKPKDLPVKKEKKSSDKKKKTEKKAKQPVKEAKAVVAENDDDAFYKECKEILSFVNEDEIETIRTSSLLLDEIINTSSNLKDLDIGKEFITNMRESYRRIVEIIKERKDYTEQEHEVTMELKQRVQTISCRYKSRCDYLQGNIEKSTSQNYKVEEEDEDDNIFADNRSTRSHEDIDSLKLENHKDSDNEGGDSDTSPCKKKADILYIDIKFNMDKPHQIGIKTLQGEYSNPKLRVYSEDYNLVKSIEHIEELLALRKSEEKATVSTAENRLDELELTKSVDFLMDSEKAENLESTNYDGQSTLDSANSSLGEPHRAKGTQSCFDEFEAREEKAVKSEAFANQRLFISMMQYINGIEQEHFSRSRTEDSSSVFALEEIFLAYFQCGAIFFFFFFRRSFVNVFVWINAQRLSLIHI